MNIQLFEFVDAKAGTNKYYRIELSDKTVISHWGKIGGPHQGPKIKAFVDDTLARKHFDKLARDKLKAGYTLTAQTEIPTGQAEDCPWCIRAGPQQLDGFVAVPYPSHHARKGCDAATRSRWLALVDQVADLAGGDVPIYWLPGPHTVALVIGNVATEQLEQLRALPPVAKPPPDPEPSKPNTLPGQQLDLFGE